jgi:hypothetical protein
MLKECKTKECQSKLQRLQMKQHRNEKYHVKDEEKRLNIIRIETGRQWSESFGNCEILRWKPGCTKLLRLRGGEG